MSLQKHNNTEELKKSLTELLDTHQLASITVKTAHGGTVKLKRNKHGFAEYETTKVTDFN